MEDLVGSLRHAIWRMAGAARDDAAAVPRRISRSGRQHDPEPRAARDRHRVLRRAVRAGVMMAIVAGIAASVAAPAGAATGAPRAQLAPAAPESSLRYTVTNLSEYTLKLDKIVGDNRFEGRPNIGETIAPGRSQIFEVQRVFCSDQRDSAEYQVIDNGKTIGRFNAYMAVLNDFWCNPVRYTDCSTVTVGTCQHNDTTLSFLNTTKTYTVTDPAAQSTLLDQYCAGAPNFSCKFNPASREYIQGPRHLSGEAYNNGTSSPIPVEITSTSKAVLTQSVEINANAKVTVAKLIEAGISGKYGTTLVTEYTFTRKISYTVLPHTSVRPESEDPLIKDTGTFVIKLGNTTWNLPGVVVTSPNVNGFPIISYLEAPFPG